MVGTSLQDEKQVSKAHNQREATCSTSVVSPITTAVPQKTSTTTSDLERIRQESVRKQENLSAMATTITMPTHNSRAHLNKHNGYSSSSSSSSTQQGNKQNSSSKYPHSQPTDNNNNHTNYHGKPFLPHHHYSSQRRTHNNNNSANNWGNSTKKRFNQQQQLQHTQPPPPLSLLPTGPPPPIIPLSGAKGKVCVDAQLLQPPPKPEKPCDNIDKDHHKQTIIRRDSIDKKINEKYETADNVPVVSVNNAARISVDAEKAQGNNKSVSGTEQLSTSKADSPKSSK